MEPYPNLMVIGSDHAGFRLKEHLKSYLSDKKIPFEDIGCFSEERVGYPDIASDVVHMMQKHPGSLGILCCGSGVGVAIGANRFNGIRAVAANDVYLAKMSRLHNNANVLCMGGRIIAPTLAEDILDTWLHTPFEGGRHESRVERLDGLVSETDLLKGHHHHA